MSDYKISFNGDKYVSEVHPIGVDYDGNYYSVIFGKYANGGFCSIPNWEAGCELADFGDVFWNFGSIGRALKKTKAARTISQAIAEYIDEVENPNT